MAGRREDVDLHLVLQDPVCARKYIKDFDWGVPNPPKYIVFGLEEKISFETMTDAEAVRAALIILKDIEIPMSFRTKETLDEVDVH